MKRRDFVGSVAMLPFAALAQQPMRRLGWFEPGTPTTAPARRKGFFEVLRARGFVEGGNLVVDYRYGYGKPETYPAIAKELVAVKPDCLLATGVDVVRALRQATTSIPIVMGTIDADPVKEGFADSLSRPGRNVTGLSGIAWELSGKRLELLRELAPKLARLAVVTDTRSPAAQAHLNETEAVARTLKVQIRIHEIVDAASVERAFRAVREAKADGLFVITVGATNTHRKLVTAQASATRLPAIYSSLESADDGGLMAYSPNLLEQYRRAAGYVDRIFKGAKAAELPIEQSRVFELVVNLRTAKEIGLKVPQSIVSRADRVIE